MKVKIQPRGNCHQSRKKTHKNLKATNTEIETFNRWNILNEEEKASETENENYPSSQMEDMSQTSSKEKICPIQPDRRN